MVIYKMFTSKPSITKDRRNPSSIPTLFIGESEEDSLLWIVSHKPEYEIISTHTRTISMMFRVGTKSCVIETHYDQINPGFCIQYRINNEYDSREIYLFEQEIFLEYLKKYFLTPDEYEQWTTKLEKDIEVSKILKKHHESGTCAGPDKCRYCIHERRDYEV